MKQKPASLVFPPLTALWLFAWLPSFPASADPYGMAFKFLGCKGPWPDDLPMAAIVKREPASRPSFLVRDPVDCGLAVKDPGFHLSGTSLALSYTVYAKGPIATCYCEYDSRFTFAHLPASIKDISFTHRSGQR